MNRPRNLADLIPTPWMGLGLALAGMAVLMSRWEPVIRVVGAVLVLSAIIWLARTTRQTRDLVARIQEAIPLADKSEQVIRALPKSWAELEQEKHQFEAELHRETGLRQALLANLTIGVVQFGHDHRIRLFNDSAQVLLGASSHLALESDLLEAFREPESLRNLDRTFQGQGTSWDLRRGSRTLGIHAVPFGAETGEAGGALLTIYDLTRQEALETTRQKFISNASHELKTPVAGIRIAAENLQEGKMVTAEGEASLRSIFRSVERMTMLLNDISELSRIETGALTLEPSELQVGPFAEALLEDLHAQTEDRSIRLVAEIPGELSRQTFKADPLRLHQLLENLLSNAIKFSPQGERVRLCVWRDGPWLAWSVIDHGPGISSTDAQRIFERFYRAPSARGVPGTGLGLSIVKHLSVLMGGEVDLKSELGQGATFTLRLPWAETKG